MNVTAETRVGDLVAQKPLASRILERYAIDFCCGGGKSLGMICSSKGLDLERLIEEIEQEITSEDREQVRWDTAPLPALIDYILERFHKPLSSELAALEEMSRKVHAVHGDKTPGLALLLQVFLGLKQELEQHMLKEERVLFPAIRRRTGPGLEGPVSVMELEHQYVGDALAQIRKLTGEYQPPDGACNTWRALWRRLEQLEHETHLHVHLENNILFPRALGVQR